MGFVGISIECLVIVLCGLFSVFPPSGYAWRHFNTASDICWHQICFYLKTNRLTQIWKKKTGKKNVPFKNYDSLRNWPQVTIPSF